VDEGVSPSEAALAAFDGLCGRLGVGSDEARRLGARVLLSKSVIPLVDIRCEQHHKLAGVWRTPEGSLFVASPAVSSGREGRELNWTVRAPEIPRHVLVVALLELHPDDEERTPLRCSCPCGLRDLNLAEREELRATVVAAKRSSRGRRLHLGARRSQ
jgi:hypothetical protein